MTQNEQATQTQPTDQRWKEIHQLLAEHPSLATQAFWDDLYRAVKDLVNGNTEQVCLNRQQDQGQIVVEWSPTTIGQRERWQGTGPG